MYSKLLVLVVRVQGHLHRGHVGAGVRGVQRREIRNHADVGDDHFEIFGIHDLANQVLDFGDVLVRHFDSRSRGRFQVDGELAGVGARKEGQSEKGVDGETGDEQRR